MSMDAKCLACKAGMTKDQYCAKNPATTGCKGAACDPSTGPKRGFCPKARKSCLPAPDGCQIFT